SRCGQCMDRGTGRNRDHEEGWGQLRPDQRRVLHALLRVDEVARAYLDLSRGRVGEVRRFACRRNQDRAAFRREGLAVPQGPPRPDTTLRAYPTTCVKLDLFSDS